MNRTPRPGELYRHFKGRTYQVITIAVHSETGEPLVIYQAMYGDFCVYARPLSEFASEVDYKKYPQAAQRYWFEKIERTGHASGKSGGAGNTVAATHQVHSKAASRSAYQAQPEAGSQPAHQAQPEAAGQPALNLQPEAAVSAEHMPDQKPRTQSPADSKRGLHIEDDEIPDTESDYFKKRRRQIEEREHRREQFRKPEKHESATDELRANPGLLRFLDADTYEEKFQVLTDIQDDMTNRLIDDMAVVLDVVIPEGPLDDRYHQLRNIILTRQKYETNRFR